MSNRHITLQDVGKAIQKAIKDGRITGKEKVFFIAIDNDRGSTPDDIRVETVPGGRVKVYDYPDTPGYAAGESRVKKATKKAKTKKKKKKGVKRNAKVRADAV